MGENGGPDVLGWMLEDPEAEGGMEQEGDGLAEGGRDFVVLAVEVDGIHITTEFISKKPQVTIVIHLDSCHWSARQSIHSSTGE